MSSLIQQLTKRELIAPPNFVVSNTQYEVMMGSIAYGVSSGASDIDVYGFCIPDKELIFPHLRGDIPGFGRQKKRFDQYQQHHIKADKQEYDISIYSIVRYFHLCMENNPNMIDSLFVPQRCVLSCTRIGDLVRENRKGFLHKGSWHKFKGYAFSQVHAMKSKNPTGKRKEIIDKYGYDVKYAYHTVRLLNEIEQILEEGDLDLQRNREQLKSIRRGEWSIERVLDYFTKKENELESLYTNSKLPYSPNEQWIKDLLLRCIEEHYGSISNSYVKVADIDTFLTEIKQLVNKYGG